VAAYLDAGPTGAPGKCLATRRPSPLMALFSCVRVMQHDIEQLHKAVAEGNLSYVSRNSGEKRCAWS